MPQREAAFNDNGFHENAGKRKEVGANCTLSLASGDDLAVTNVSFSEEANTSEVQYTDSFAQSIAVTGVTYSGSFEIPGNANAQARDVGWDQGSGEQPTLPNHLDQITITDGEDRSYTFKNVLINSHSKDIPSDDRTTQSFDFMAEALTIA